jgi:hypothetical protein
MEQAGIIFSLRFVIVSDTFFQEQSCPAINLEKNAFQTRILNTFCNTLMSVNYCQDAVQFLFLFFKEVDGVYLPSEKPVSLGGY